MNLRTGLVVRLGNFVFKHAVATSVVVGLSVAFSVLLYIALLIWAIVTNDGLGGPLALAGMMLAAFVGSIASVIVVLFPVTVMSQVACAKVRNFRWIAEITVSNALLITGVFAVTLANDGIRTSTIGSKAQAGTALSVILLTLLGIYWWSAHATEMVTSATMRAWHRMAARCRKGHAA